MKFVFVMCCFEIAWTSFMIRILNWKDFIYVCYSVQKKNIEQTSSEAFQLSKSLIDENDWKLLFWKFVLPVNRFLYWINTSANFNSRAKVMQFFFFFLLFWHVFKLNQISVYIRCGTQQRDSGLYQLYTLNHTKITLKFIIINRSFKLNFVT